VKTFEQYLSEAGYPATDAMNASAAAMARVRNESQTIIKRIQPDAFRMAEQLLGQGKPADEVEAQVADFLRQQMISLLQKPELFKNLLP
jgi:hypothetical protein